MDYDPTTMHHPRRSEAIEMRKNGFSYREISKTLGISRSTLSYMLRDIVLTPRQRERLKAKMIEGAIQTTEKYRSIPTEIRRAWGKQGAATVLNKYGITYFRALLSPEIRERAHLSYRKDELEAKSRLELIYNRTFYKERIGNRIVDFACADVIIEHTVDHTHGVYDLIRRFEEIAHDRRRKIAYLPADKIGPKSRQRLDVIGVEILDYRALA